MIFEGKAVDFPGLFYSVGGVLCIVNLLVASVIIKSLSGALWL